MTSPLSGVRVLDLTNVLAGPFCCHQLAHLGAEVIRVERPGAGDLARQLGNEPELSAKNMGAAFLAQNAGKSSVTVNMKTEAGKDVLRRLVKGADVLVENFRPGVMDRLGLGYEALKKIRPELIYCAISGYGQTGGWKHRPAYDQIIQGASGLMSVTGDAQSAPLRVGYPVADTIGGLTAAFAVSAALNAKPRGAFLDISMLELVIATMGWAVSNWLISGETPQPHGNENVTSSPSGAFATGEGLLNIAANKTEQWEMLAKHIGVEELIADPRFRTRDDRKKNRAALKPLLEAALSRKSAADWTDELNAIGVPAGEVLSIPKILESAQIRDRGMIARFDDIPEVGRPVELLRTGVRINGEPAKVESPPPALGADTDRVLGELGFSEDEITALRGRGDI